MMKGVAFRKAKTVLRFLDASDSKVWVHCCNAYHLSLSACVLCKQFLLRLDKTLGLIQMQTV